jgi:hypothetical protein
MTAEISEFGQQQKAVRREPKGKLSSQFASKSRSPEPINLEQSGGHGTVQHILCRLTEIWNDLTFEDVHSVFHEWQIRLSWVTENGREYYFE